MYYVTKSWGAERGLSCAFRQWRATSHCRLIHGYALSFSITFGAKQLDERNWVIDFGGLKPVKEWLEKMFDHTTLVAEDDPQLDLFATLHREGLIQMVKVPHTGCEAVAQIVYEHVQQWLDDTADGRVWVQKVSCREHDANTATFTRGVK